MAKHNTEQKQSIDISLDMSVFGYYQLLARQQGLTVGRYIKELVTKLAREAMEA